MFCYEERMPNNAIRCALCASSLFAFSASGAAIEKISDKREEGLETIVVTADWSATAVIDVPAHVTSVEMEKRSANWLGGAAFNLSETNLPFSKEYYVYHGGTNAARLAVPGVPRQLRLSIRKYF